MPYRRNALVRRLRTNSALTRISRLNSTIFALVTATTFGAALAYGTVHEPMIALFYLLCAVLVILWAVDGYRRGEIRLPTTPIQLPLLLFAGYAFLQGVPFGIRVDETGLSVPRTISVAPFESWQTASHLLMLLSFFAVAIVTIDSYERAKRAVAALTIFGAGFSFYAILQAVLSPDKIYGIYSPISGATPFGSFVNRHNYAALMEICISLPLGMLFAGAVEREKRLLYFVAVGLMGASLLVAGSRGGLVALLAAMLLIVLLTSRTRGRRSVVLKVALAVAIVAASIAGALFVGGETSLTRFADAARTEDLSSKRFEIWSGTISVIREHFPFGAGLGAFPQAFSRFDPGSGVYRAQQAHNDYLQVAADAGLIGVVLGIWFLYLFAYLGRRAVATSASVTKGLGVGAIAGLFAVLIHSLFDFVLHITAISAAFLYVLAVLIRLAQEASDSKAPQGAPSKPLRYAENVSQKT
jgi:O-antigen ligase